MRWVLLSEVLLMFIHNMFSWRNKKNISVFRLKKKHLFWNYERLKNIMLTHFSRKTPKRVVMVGGHIVFSADPVGVSGVGVSSCPHSVSLLNGHILAKLTQIYPWEGGKMLIRFWWPWPHFQGHRRAKIVGKRLVRTISLEGMNRF